MMARPPILEKISNFIYKNFAGKPGTFLLVAGTIGWTASSTSQIIAMLINDKIPDAQKKFLIPQEMADAAINIASFFCFTRLCTRMGEKLVESGRLATPKIRGFLTKYKMDSKVCTDSFNILKAPQLNEMDKNFDKDFSKAYYNLADGVSFVSSTIGSIISCNIITPILRNKFASMRQKQALEREKLQNEGLLPTSPILPAYNKTGRDDNKKPVVNLNLTRTPSSGSMRV